MVDHEADDSDFLSDGDADRPVKKRPTRQGAPRAKRSAKDRKSDSIGSPQRDYSAARNRVTVENALAILLAYTVARRYGAMAELSRECGIPESTLRGWRDHLKKDPDWTPWNNHYGEHFRIFTDEQEDELMQLARENWLDTHKLFTNDDFRDLALGF